MANDSLLLVGTYTQPMGFVSGAPGKGIHAFRFDAATGKLTPLGVTEGIENPSFLAVDPSGAFVYCANELHDYEGRATGAVSSFRLDRASGELSFLNRQDSHGTDPCHVMADPSGRTLVVANYSSGSVASYPVAADGSLGKAACVIQHSGSSVNTARQAGPHAHEARIDPAGRFVYVPELGMDKVMIYALDALASQLTANPAQATLDATPGAGPRHIVLHPNGRNAYVINELNSTITACAWDPASGTLGALQSLSTLPAGFSGESTCAEVQIAPSGRFVYGSNRGDDSIAIFALDPESGRMTPVGHQKSGGRTPRHFTFTPDGGFVLAAHQDSGNIVVFRADAESGGLTPTGEVAEVGAPVCLLFP